MEITDRNVHIEMTFETLGMKEIWSKDLYKKKNRQPKLNI